MVRSQDVGIGVSSVVSALASRARGTRIDPRCRQGNYWCLNMLSFVSFASMT